MMVKITLQIDGMQCSMCEAHINEVIRQKFHVKKVTSSHSQNQTILIAPDDIQVDELKKAIGETGYGVLSVVKEPYEKKGFLSSLHK